MNRRTAALVAAAGVLLVGGALAWLVPNRHLWVGLWVLGFLVALGLVLLWRARVAAASARVGQKRLEQFAKAQELVPDRLDALDRALAEVRLQNGRAAQQLDRLAHVAEGLTSRAAGSAHALERVNTRLDNVGRQLNRAVGASGPGRTPADLVRAAVLTDLVTDGDRPQVVLVLNSFAAQQVFAGIRTAFVTAVGLAQRLGRDLRVVVLEPLASDHAVEREALQDLLRSDLGADDLADKVTLSSVDQPIRTGFHADDVWLATFWTTALQLGRRCAAGELEARRVVYLVQDWEPSFYPAGTQQALAESTYRLGFHLVVNSSPLAAYVSRLSGIEVPPDQVFAPQVDPDRLTAAAQAWTPGAPGEPRLLFYARPSKPRNMYDLGVAALRAWVDALPEEVRPVVTFAGEPLDPPNLGPRAAVRSVGKVGLEDYYALLTTADLGLALMQSPHPSHLPLELPVAGIPTVTNTFGEIRTSWVPGLRVADPTPAALAAALVAVTDDVRETQRHEPQTLDTSLGRTLDDCVDTLVARLG